MVDENKVAGNLEFLNSAWSAVLGRSDAPGLEQARLIGPRGWQRGADFMISGGHRGAAARGAHEETLHDEEGFVDFLDGGSILTDGDGK